MKTTEKLAALAFTVGLFPLVVTNAQAQALTGLSLGSEVRETIRGDRPGGDSQGPIESGEIDIIGVDPTDGQPDDPFTNLPDPNQSFDPSEGADIPGDPFGEEPDPNQSFDPTEGMDMSEDPFSKDPDPNQSFDPTEGMDMPDDPFSQSPDPNQSFDPTEGMDMPDDPFSQSPDPNQSFDPTEGMDMPDDPFGSDPVGGQPAEPVANGTGIIIYRTPSCPYCKQANDVLVDEGVIFEERDVQKDPRWAAEMNAKLKAAGKPATGAVPVIEINGQLIVGFNESLLRQLCKASK